MNEIECPKCGHPPRDIASDYVTTFKAQQRISSQPVTLFGHCRTGHRIAVVVTQDEPPHVAVIDQ